MGDEKELGQLIAVVKSARVWLSLLIAVVSVVGWMSWVALTLSSIDTELSALSRHRHSADGTVIVRAEDARGFPRNLGP